MLAIPQVPEDQKTWLLYAGSLLVVAVLYKIVRRLLGPRPVYLMEIGLYEAPEELWCPQERFIGNSTATGWFSPESIEFQRRLLANSSLGPRTAFPPGLLATPPVITIKGAREECEMIFTQCIDKVFERTKLTPRDIDILIVNCTIFNPIPSIGSMIINHYKMRTDVRLYCLGSMGCSAGVIALDLAREMLQLYPNSNVLVFSHENITNNWYLGNQKGMLITNTLFRIGGAAVLLTNKASCARKAMARLMTTVRVHTGSDDASSGAIVMMEDDLGKKGVRLSKELVALVGRALAINIRRLMPHVLPLREKLAFVVDWLRRRLSAKYRKDAPREWVPDFHSAVDYFCIHAGGRAVIDGVAKGLNLTAWDAQPSKATLYDHGNTSSSSVWYEFDWVMHHRAFKAGQRVWQISFGSGLKCNSAVWELLHSAPASALEVEAECRRQIAEQEKRDKEEAAAKLQQQQQQQERPVTPASETRSPAPIL